ncbi:hypothetical protein R50073_09530 [Maricurvus nonylphenolicus]
MAARLSESPSFMVTLLEAGPDHDAYDADVFTPLHASDAWSEDRKHHVPSPMKADNGVMTMMQGRLLGGTSTLNGMATLRGQPGDYDAWADAGLEGWGWQDVRDTFIAAERDRDFGTSPLHGNAGPLPVRRWRKQELSHAQATFCNGLVNNGQPFSHDINDPDQLPGVGIFPVTIDENAQRVTTSLAYLTEEVRRRGNLNIRTNAPVERILIENGQATSVLLESGEELAADEIVLSAGAIWSAKMLLRSGVGPKEHLAKYGINVHADLPVGSTMSDHLGPGILYRHPGSRGSDAGPAQVVFVGASNGHDVDYHAMPISLQDPNRNPLTFSEKLKLIRRASTENSKITISDAYDALKFLMTPTKNDTMFMLALFLLCSSGQGSVRLGDTPDADPVVTAPPLPKDAHQRLRHAFDVIAAWEGSDEFRNLGLSPVFPQDLSAPDAVAIALARNTISYGHMVGTCPMGTVLDADCRVLGIPNLRVADASVMPTIPRGNTYLGCVMVAERIAAKMKMQSTA